MLFVPLVVYHQAQRTPFFVSTKRLLPLRAAERGSFIEQPLVLVSTFFLEIKQRHLNSKQSKQHKSSHKVK